MLDIRSLTIDARVSLREALECMNRAGERVLLIVDGQQRLVRTVTDGDLRRLLLAGRELASSLDALPPQSPITARESLPAAEALELLNRHSIDHLPLVDEAGRPVELVLRRELDRRILLSTPHLGDDEQMFVAEAFRSNWVAPLGPNVDAFEREFAVTVGLPHAAALSSGTAALHLALQLIGVGPGDLVFCSSFTFVASANPILYLGARPAFIDSEPASWNMSPGALRIALEAAARAGRLPKAVMVVHLYGQSADMEPLLGLCAQYGVPVIEDAAESLGATYRGRATGSFGRMAAFSFNGNKIITTSGGGMLASADGALIERARFLATQARERVPWYQHEVVGYNYRMSNVLAGIGRGQLRVLADRVRARRAIFERYRSALAGIEEIGWMPEAAYGSSTRWLSVCTLDPRSSPVTPSELIEALARSGVEARHAWKPLHLQPLFAGCDYYTDGGRSFADEVFATGLCLPSGSNMTEQEQERTILAIQQVFARAVQRRAAAGR